MKGIVGRVLLLAPISLLIVAAIVLSIALQRGGAPPDPETIVGSPFPQAELPGLPGRDVGLAMADYAGRTVIVNVFASWCAPCRVEHPLLMDLADYETPLVGVAWKDAPDAAAAFLAELGDPYEAVGADLEGRLGDRLGVTGAPETFVVGPDGTIVWRWAGPLTPVVVARRLIPALTEAESTAASGAEIVN